MRNLLFVLCLIPTFILAENQDLETLLKILDKEVESSAQYAKAKEDKIIQLKNLLKITHSKEQQLQIYNQLFEEYFYFQKDSALHYSKLYYQHALDIEDKTIINLAKIDMAYILGTMGLFKESLDYLSDIPIEKYRKHKFKYYMVTNVIYFHMSLYAANKEESEKYMKLFRSETDSLLHYTSKDSTLHVRTLFSVLKEDGKLAEALESVLAYFPKVTNIHEKARIANNIAEIYNLKNDTDNEIYWLTISSINDLKSVTKEYVSLRNLAFKLYEKGEIERAYKYIFQSMNDALFCNARLRTYEISKMLPIINEAYQHQEKSKQKLIRFTLTSISVLTLFLIFFIWRVYRQMKKLAIARKELSDVNEQLNLLNKELTNINQTLNEANLIKEEYIAKYMDQCSLYIDKMDDYRRNLQKTALTGKLEELTFKIKSKDFIEDVLLDFYQNFDKTFLQLFPNFVNEVNKLIVEEERIHLKPGQLLNTEFRMYALIRLGINDSIKIAGFLRCSPNTIYNYRTRNRNNAIGDRDSLEAKIIEIGTVNVN